MIAIFLFLLLLGFIWVAVPQDNKKVADIQYKIVIVGLGLILLLGSSMSLRLSQEDIGD